LQTAAARRAAAAETKAAKGPMARLRARPHHLGKPNPL